jgi:hypothetical protein
MNSVAFASSAAYHSHHERSNKVFFRNERSNKVMDMIKRIKTVGDPDHEIKSAGEHVMPHPSHIYFKILKRTQSRNPTQIYQKQICRKRF